MRDALLSLRRISRTFGGVQAAVDVDLDVHRGEVLALVGDNAAGKSTIARLMGGVLQPTSGEIWFDGRQVSIPSPRAATALGIASVFQESSLVENLDVVDNLYLGQELRTRLGLLDHHLMRQQARHHLGALSARVPDPSVPLRQLSAGQRQCVAIARTLVSDPSLVVLDEPTASLSVGQTAEVLSYIDGLREQGLGVVLISHNLGDVRAIADRIEVLRHGRNNGSFLADEASYEAVLAAITGATHLPPRR
ncbi:monosaccharide ABC transporter ATP-binding protein (CUT2 family) [Luteococcus japonicus]|uniref:Monosaccharide ABC transporter ATP-binding protein (CUT2 family) n=1 Tax=Luteococcus japonicus TaxID=33984 RepID=A0A3N1ZXT0_9ACTN|nr:MULTISPECIES: ATP-binding cassette domain-containing protein [Luteococcus]MDN5563863.1 ATP-binding cassette domain-containing protein [Luteococcus sp.]ROR55665.1 monosaccharide ABC transporter ATP-binding protein (CUT2 family) [Luteococcus japonicus]